MRWDLTPAADRDSTPRSDEWCDRLVTDGRGRDLQASFGLAAAGSDYSIPIERDATVTRRVYLRPGWAGKFAAKVGAKHVTGRIPPANGRDGHKVTITPDGHETDFWGLSWATAQSMQRPQSAAVFHGPNWLTRPPFQMSADAVAATVVECRRPDGAWIGDDDTGNAQGFICAPLSRGVTLAAEVASGVVRHALRCSTGYPLAGPLAPSEVQMDDPRIGTQWAATGLPCSLHEGHGKTVTGCTPHGLHVVVEKTDRQIDADLDAAKLTGGAREVSRVLRVALRDYGVAFLLSAAAGGAPTIQCNGADRDAWRKLGVPSKGRSILAGAIDSAAELRALAWPTTVVDGRVTNRATWCAEMTV